MTLKVWLKIQKKNNCLKIKINAIWKINETIRITKCTYLSQWDELFLDYYTIDGVCKTRILTYVKHLYNSSIRQMIYHR